MIKWVVPRLHAFEREDERVVGYLPVYDDLGKLLEDFPNEGFLTLENPEEDIFSFEEV